MRFGVNYTPSHGWFYSWLDPHWDSVARDFDAIAAIGLDHIRMFPLWPILQPNRTWINKRALEDVHHMALLASERGLDVYSDVLQGHMSSFDFVPPWLVSWHETSMFADQAAIDSQANLIKAVYESLADIPRFCGLTIGNECNQFADAVHPRRMKATSDDVDRWVHRLLAPISSKARQQGHMLVHSENDAVWYENGSVFQPRLASNVGDVSSIHSWVFNGTAQAYGGLSLESTRHAEYLIELSKAFSNSPDRPVWLQEIGAPENVMDSHDTVSFCHNAVIHALDCSNLHAITWWCSHNVNHAFSDFPVFEHDLGIFDEEGKLKPIGHEFADLAHSCKQMEPASRRGTAIIVPCDEVGNPLARAACAPGGSVFERWMDLSRQGLRPTLISSALASDRQALSDRGITSCVTVDLHAGNVYNVVPDSSIEPLEHSCE